MRWLRYEADGREAYGIIEGDEVVEVKGDPFAGYERTATRRKLASGHHGRLTAGPPARQAGTE